MFNKIQPNQNSRQGMVLRFIREEKKLSLPIVAKIVGIKAAAIDHMENGRKIITEKDVQLFLNCYGISQNIFLEILEIKLLTKHAVNLYFLKK